MIWDEAEKSSPCFVRSLSIVLVAGGSEVSEREKKQVPSGESAVRLIRFPKQWESLINERILKPTISRCLRMEHVPE